MANQDVWARPLAKELVDLFRVASLDFVRITSAYDPATGIVTSTETTFTGAGAVTKWGNNEEGGVGGPQALECWCDLQGLGDIWPTTADQLEYDGARWKIISIDPAYSGDVKYAVKLTARYA